MITPRVIVVIISYNGEKWIDACIQSIFKNNYKNLQIVLVDNASKDRTLSIAKDSFENVVVFSLKKNIGYGRGANIGIDYALSHKADYVLLLNQDVKLASNCIENLVKACHENSNIGIASPIQMTYDGSKVDPAFERLLESSKSFQEDVKLNKILKNSYEVDTIIGAAILFRVATLETIGLFDPLYFLYHEEGDLCRRAKYHGFQIHFIPHALIFHWHTQLRPSKMTFRAKLSSLYGYYFFILKNPFSPADHNFCSFLRQMKKWVFRDKEMVKIIRRFFVNMIAMFIVLLCLPRLLKSRRLDMKGGIII